MPSPFPGMNPWLESPAHWHNVHRSLIALIYTELNRTLPEGFAATMDENVYILTPQNRILPDVAVVRTSDSTTAPLNFGSGGGVVTLTRPVEVAPLESDEEQRIPFVQIVATTHGEQRVVTVIEVLSPINKTGPGREQYRIKQRDILRSAAHLLEIDLLRGGRHTVAVEEQRLLARHKATWDYVICLHRAGFGDQFTCWPFTMRDSLPAIAVPLADGLPEQPLDLTKLFEQCYTTGPFRRTVDYTKPPTPRLKHEDAVWAVERLKP